MSVQNPDYNKIAQSALSSINESLDDDDSLDIVGSLFSDLGFKNAEAVFFHGGGSFIENQKRAELYSEVVGLLRQNGSEADLVAPSEDLELLQGYLPGENFADFEFEGMEDYLSNAEDYESSIHVTGRSQQYELDDLLDENRNSFYLVLGV